MTKNRERELKELGYHLIVVWEHQFRYQLEKIRIYNNSSTPWICKTDLIPVTVSSVVALMLLYKLHYKVKEDEKTQYYDFTSLYPWKNKYCRYPLGHRTIITSDFGDMSDYFGLAKIKVLPPRKLYHPVLPYRSQGKVYMFCRGKIHHGHVVYS
jgi:hypothetical protein